MLKSSSTFIWTRLIPAISRNDENNIQARFIRQACRKSLREKRKLGIIRENRKTNDVSYQGTIAKTLNALSQIVAGKDPNVDHLTSKEKENTSAPSSSNVEPSNVVQTKESVDNKTSAKTKKSSPVLLFKKKSFYNSSCTLVNPSFPSRIKKPKKSRIQRYFEELNREQKESKINPTGALLGGNVDNFVKPAEKPAALPVKSNVLDSSVPTPSPSIKLEALKTELSSSKLSDDNFSVKHFDVATPSSKSKLEILKAELASSNVTQQDLSEKYYDVERAKSIMREKERLEQDLRYVRSQKSALDLQKDLIRPTSHPCDVPFKSKIPEEPEETSPAVLKSNSYQWSKPTLLPGNANTQYQTSVPSDINQKQTGYSYNQYTTPPLTSQSQYPTYQSNPSLTSHNFAPHLQGTQSDSQFNTKKKDGIFKTLKNKLFFWRRKSKDQTSSAGGSVTHTSVPSLNQNSSQPNYLSSQSYPLAYDYKQTKQPSQTLTSQNFSVPALTQNISSVPSKKYPVTPSKRSLAAKYSNAVRDFTGGDITDEKPSNSTPMLHTGAKSYTPRSEPRSLASQYASSQSDPYKISPQSVQPQKTLQNFVPQTNPPISQYSSQNSQSFAYNPIPQTVAFQPSPNTVPYQSLPDSVINQPTPQSFGFQSQPQMVQSSIMQPFNKQDANIVPSNVFNPLAFFSQPQSYPATQTQLFQATQPQQFQSTLPQPFQAAQPQSYQATLPQPFQAPNLQPFQAAQPQPFQSVQTQPFQAAKLQPFQAAQPQSYQATLPQPFQAAQPQSYQATLPQPFQAAQPQSFHAMQIQPLQVAQSQPFQVAQPQSYQAAVNATFPVTFPNQVTATSSMFQFPTNTQQTFIPQPASVTSVHRFPYVATVMPHLKHPWFQTMQNSALITPLNQYINRAAAVIAPINLQRYLMAVQMSKQLQLPRAYQAGLVLPLSQCANRGVAMTPQQPYYYPQCPQYLMTQKRYV